MEEALRARIIWILSIVAGIFFVAAMGSCSSSSRMRRARDKEMVRRLDVEENLSKLLQEKGSSEQQAKSLSQQLQEEKTAHESAKKALLQEQLVSEGLREELDKMTKLKETLEEDLKEALSKSKVKK